LSSVPARRGHGQHAARHGKGKPARRWRGSNTAKSAAQTPTAQTPTAETLTAETLTAETLTAETLTAQTLISDTGSPVKEAETAADSRAPWERGDAR